MTVAAIGYPGHVVHGKPVHEPYNLGKGWVGFDYAKGLGCPVKVINDAAMQAVGSYEGGRMEGGFRAEAHHLGLEQELPADACADIFFLADLKGILERYGNRGYRAVQLDAGAIGGRDLPGCVCPAPGCDRADLLRR
jgi:hypothetical protein